MLVEIARCLAADRRLHGGVDVAGRQSVAGRLGPVDVDAHGRLSQRTQHRQIDHARDLCHHVADLVGGTFQHLQIGAVELHRVLALHAGGCLLDVVLDVLREVEVHTRELVCEPVHHLLGQRLLADLARPFVGRFQRHEEFGVKEAGGVGAVIGAAVLGDHGDRLGEAAHHRAHAIDVAVAFLQRNRGRQSGADPEVAFFQLGQEFQPQRLHGKACDHQQHDHAADHDDPVAQRESGHRRIDVVQEADDKGFLLIHLARQQQRAQRRGHGEGGQQPTGDGVGVGFRHRPEDVTFDAAEGEQRHEGGDDDGCSEEDALAHLDGGIGDHRELAAQFRGVAHPLQHRRMGETISGLL